MKSIKAILAGSLFIIIVGVLIELAYIFIAVGYNNLARQYPILNDISIYLRYMIGIPVLFVVMFFGGLITADLAKRHIYIHCLIVALITISVMMLSATENLQITISGAIVSILALVSTLAGGWYWQRGNKNNE
jgi:hypothetical protein